MSEGRRKTPRARRAARVLTGLVAFVVAAWLGWNYWKTHRTQPAPFQRNIFRGVELRRITRKSPRPLVIYLVTIRLDEPKLSFLVTPANLGAGQPLRGQTTSQFARKYGASLAINADGFTPWWSKNIFNYYPHVGDPVTPIGLSASRGHVYERGSKTRPWAPVFLAKNNRVSFEKPIGATYNAVSGLQMLLRDGQVSREVQTLKRDRTEPRTAIALDRSGKKLFFLIVDGRQQNYSEGVTLRELASLARDFGGHTALNLDGGGSTALVVRDGSGQYETINSPINNGIPGRERAVANHLGVFAEAL